MSRHEAVPSSACSSSIAQDASLAVRRCELAARGPRGGLGRGLGALIPRGAAADAAAAPGAAEVPIEAIEANPRQPRHRMDPEQLADLAASIREHGIIQPLIVTRAPD